MPKFYVSLENGLEFICNADTHEAAVIKLWLRYAGPFDGLSVAKALKTGNWLGMPMQVTYRVHRGVYDEAMGIRLIDVLQRIRNSEPLWSVAMKACQHTLDGMMFDCLMQELAEYENEPSQEDEA